MDKRFTKKGAAFFQIITEGRCRRIHLVIEIDTAYLICQGNGEVNNLRGSLIRAGDTLMIPDNTAWRESLALAGTSGRGRRRQGYTVRPGDSLYRIARRFEVTIDDLVTWNDLDPRSYLQPGQSLTLYVDGG